MLRNPPNLVHFAISGGAPCLPPLVVFRSPHTICDDLLGVAKVALRNIVSVQGKVCWCLGGGCFFFFFFFFFFFLLNVGLF